MLSGLEVRAFMSSAVLKRLNLPNLRSNPFDTRPLDKDDIELMVGREVIFESLVNHIRFFSPRVIGLVGERGSGRTSLVQILSGMTEQTHHVWWPSEDVESTILGELYCNLLNDFEIPPVHSVLIERLKEDLAGRTSRLPLVVLDLPNQPGPELAEALSKLMSTFSRLRALFVVTMTPGQKSAMPDDLLSEMDITPPLETFSRNEMAKAISKRISKASRSSWNPPSFLIDMVMEQTGGHPSRSIRLLRDIVDHARGMPLTEGRTLDLSIILEAKDPTPVDDETFQRVSEAASPRVEATVTVAEDVTLEPVLESEAAEDKGEPRPLAESGSLFPDLSSAAEMWSEFDQEEPEYLPEPESLPTNGHPDSTENISVEPLEEESEYGDVVEENVGDTTQTTLFSDDFTDEAAGTELLEMQSGTAPAPGGGRMGGLRARTRSTNMGINEVKMPPRKDDTAARPNEDKPDPNQLRQIPTRDPNIGFWVQEGAEPILPITPPSATPLQPMQPATPSPPSDFADDETGFQTPPLEDEVVGPSVSELMGGLTSIGRPTALRPSETALDVNALMSLSDAEMMILEKAIEGEISPSNDELQSSLGVGRPRLSQLFNGLARYGILVARKQGRSRLFSISEQAKHHLAAMGSGGDDS